MSKDRNACEATARRAQVMEWVWRSQTPIALLYPFAPWAWAEKAMLGYLAFCSIDALAITHSARREAALAAAEASGD